MALELELASKSGSWFTYGEARIGQGRENAKQYLDENPAVAAELERRVRALSLRAVDERPLTTFSSGPDGDAGLALAI